MCAQAAAFEQALALHCAPALTALAPANLVSLPTAEFPGLSGLLEAYNARLSAKGLAFTPLCQCRSRVLLLVYRPAFLDSRLKERHAARYLAGLGYPVSQGLDACLEVLRRRLNGGGDFPHEIGLFLGYPLADVVGFCALGGECAKLSGHWKVYGDVDYAKRCFRRFDESRAALCQGLAEGRTLLQLLGAVPMAA